MQHDFVERPWKLYKGWLNPIESLFWKNLIYTRLDWEQPMVYVYGKNYLVPRKTSFIASKGINYKYSGFTHNGHGWPSWFEPLLNKVNNSFGENFNGCLANFYKNGKDSMGWHSDREPELDPTKPIVSLSLGATRDFCLRNYARSLKDKIPLANGDLFLMEPPCQNHWQHCLPKRLRVLESRINLTFRCYY